MKTSLSLALALAMTSLAACGPQDSAAPKEGDGAMMDKGSMPMGDAMQGSMPMKEGMGMGTAAAAKTAKGTGVVTAVDAAAGTITIDHGPIPEAGWPAMEMGFQASPDLAQGVSVGDQVAFDLALKEGGGEITAIAKR